MPMIIFFQFYLVKVYVGIKTMSGIPWSICISKPGSSPLGRC